MQVLGFWEGGVLGVLGGGGVCAPCLAALPAACGFALTPGGLLLRGPHPPPTGTVAGCCVASVSTIAFRTVLKGKQKAQRFGKKKQNHRAHSQNHSTRELPLSAKPQILYLCLMPPPDPPHPVQHRGAAAARGTRG